MELIHRLSAFSTTPEGGNPAGVWLGPELPIERDMRRMAAEVGYSETVFAAAGSAPNCFDVRYFSPEAEVPFCGHATVALGVHLGQTLGAGTYELTTMVGLVPVKAKEESNHWTATLTSVEPHSSPAPIGLVSTVLDILDWTRADLSDSFEPAITFAGAKHLVLTANNRARLADTKYRFEEMKTVMLGADLTTVNLVWFETDKIIHARNLFPVGGVVEDPATGAAAAALVGHLRSVAHVVPPADITIHQGYDMGRPSLLSVHAPTSGGIEVSGSAVPIGS